MTGFWSDTLTAWCEIHFRTEEKVEDNNVGKQLIWLNSLIRTQYKPFIWNKPYKKGLLHVEQLFPQGEKITTKIAQEAYDLSFLQGAHNYGTRRQVRENC